MRPQWRDPSDPSFDAFRGGITWALDNLLWSLEEASRKEDAREYASLAAQLAVLLAPKLSPQEYEELSVPKVVLADNDLSRRAVKREYERLLFAAARSNVAGMLRLISERGIYSKKDESAPTPEDASALAVRD